MSGAVGDEATEKRREPQCRCESVLISECKRNLFLSRSPPARITGKSKFSKNNFEKYMHKYSERNEGNI